MIAGYSCSLQLLPASHPSSSGLEDVIRETSSPPSHRHRATVTSRGERATTRQTAPKSSQRRSSSTGSVPRPAADSSSTAPILLHAFEGSPGDPSAGGQPQKRLTAARDSLNPWPVLRFLQIIPVLRLVHRICPMVLDFP
jgi:hypothetical protein